MPISVSTIKRLFAKSGNKCAMCPARLVSGETLLVEICHIRARRKNGARFDSSLTVAEKDDFKNLLLLCPTCHTRIDKDQKTFTPGMLFEIKEYHERSGSVEITPDMARPAMMIFEKLCAPRITKANAKDNAVAVAIGGDNHAPITINKLPSKTQQTKGYPMNSIGADANLTNYIEYLCGLYVEYMSGLESADTSWGKIGKHIKTKFRLKKRTRNHLSAERFDELVDYLVSEKLANTPVGKLHLRRGTKLCRTFDEFRFGKM